MTSAETRQMQTKTGITFLSGGTALNRLATCCAERGLFADYIVPVFDNGGSSGRLRDAFGCIAIGDARNRLTAIASRRTSSIDSTARLFSERAPDKKPPAVARAMIDECIDGRNALEASIEAAALRTIRESVGALVAKAPSSFNWSGASLGNLAILGRYFCLKRDWDATMDWAHDILDAVGNVLPVSYQYAHLGARLKDDSYVLGQAALTDEARPLRSPIAKLALHPSDRSSAKAIQVTAQPRALASITHSSGIVFGWGSIYTSILPLLMVESLASAVAASAGPRVLLLNPLRDVETAHCTAVDIVSALVNMIQTYGTPAGPFSLTHVIVIYPTQREADALYVRAGRQLLEQLGLKVIEISSAGIPDRAEVGLVVDTLIDLVRSR